MPQDITPHVDEIRWEVDPYCLEEIAERHWSAIEWALKDIYMRHENFHVHGPSLKPQDQQTRSIQAVKLMTETR